MGYSIFIMLQVVQFMVIKQKNPLKRQIELITQLVYMLPQKKPMNLWLTPIAICMD